MQELLNVHDEAKIASASRQHSMESQSRAHLTGLLQSVGFLSVNVTTELVLLLMSLVHRQRIN